MSSYTFREMIYSGWAVPGLPLLKTINEYSEVPQNDSPWATIAFSSETVAPVTMGSNPWIQEIGTASVLIGVASGDSDLVVARAAEEVKKFWHLWTSPDGSAWILSVNGPRPPDPDAQGITYTLVVDLVYTFQYRGA